MPNATTHTHLNASPDASPHTPPQASLPTPPHASLHASLPAPACVVEPLPCLGGQRRRYRGVLQPFPAHAHAHYVIGRVLAGCRHMELNGRALVLEPGDVLVLNPGDVHGCTQSGEEPFAFDSVTIARHVLPGATLKLPDRSEHEACQAAGEALAHLEAALDDAGPTKTTSPSDATTETDDADLSARDAAILKAVHTLADLLQASPTVRESAHEQAVMRTHAHLVTHLADPLGIDQLAAAEGISPYALIRAYRQRFAMTPMRHLASLRVEAASALLARGASPAEAAAATGFADQAHLTRAFKQRMGTTPAAYRRMVREGRTS